MNKKRYKITGMTCSSCSSHVQKAIDDLDNVTGVVSLLNNSLDIESNQEIDDLKIIEAVKKAGYGASIYESESVLAQTKKVDKQRNILISSIILQVILMYIAMGEMMHLPMPFFLVNKYILLNVVLQLILTISIIIIHRKYFINGFKNLFKLRPNMDSLVASGSLASFIYAAIVTVMIFTNYESNFNHAMHLMHELYYDSAAMILVFVYLGKYLEGLSKKQTTKALEELMELVPDTTLKLVNNEYVSTKIDNITVGDIIEVRPYEIIPLDGIIVDGASFIDTSSLTGESVCVYKTNNDSVLSGTKNQEGILHIKTTSSKEDSTMTKIVELVEKASSSKMSIERLVDKVAFYFTPIVLLISVITLISWLVFNKDIPTALQMAISVLVISCPCALGLATPLCVMVSTLKASKYHILIKNATVFEQLVKVDTVFLDKTGTLTKGKLSITSSTLTKEQTKIAASIEQYSEHPLSKVVTSSYQGKYYEVEDFKSYPGKGVSGKINDTLYFIGNTTLLNEYCKNKDLDIPNSTYLVLFTNDHIEGTITFEDELKPTSKKAIELFKKHHIKTYMLTGDNDATARKVMEELSLDGYFANMLPTDKASKVEEFQKNNHHVLMIGDGINDAVALQTASVGISMNSTNISKNSSDVILSKNDILDAYNVLWLAHKTVNKIKLNLFWAFFYNIIMIPVAAGVFFIPFGIRLNPMIGAACMSLSSICVCLNALTLNKIKFIHPDPSISFYVNDMMCSHCVNRIKKALSVDGVNDIDIDLSTKKVSVMTNLSQEDIFELITKAGYKPSK